MSDDEFAYRDLDLIYFAWGMVDSKIIDQLEARTRSGSTDPAVFRVLGDRYVEVGFPKFAKPKYQRALVLAKQF